MSEKMAEIHYLHCLKERLDDAVWSKNLIKKAKFADIKEFFENISLEFTNQSANYALLLISLENLH